MIMPRSLGILHTWRGRLPRTAGSATRGPLHGTLRRGLVVGLLGLSCIFGGPTHPSAQAADTQIHTIRGFMPDLKFSLQGRSEERSVGKACRRGSAPELEKENQM